LTRLSTDFENNPNVISLINTALFVRSKVLQSSLNIVL